MSVRALTGCLIRCSDLLTFDVGAPSFDAWQAIS